MFPHYWRVENADAGKDYSTITIICTNQAALLADAVIRQAEQPGVKRAEISAAQLAANYDQALEQGISVPADHWDDLNAAAWPILVPTDQNSRAGAGPG